MLKQSKIGVESCRSAWLWWKVSDSKQWSRRCQCFLVPLSQYDLRKKRRLGPQVVDKKMGLLNGLVFWDNHIRKPWFSHQIWGFPVDFPSTQSNEIDSIGSCNTLYYPVGDYHSMSSLMQVVFSTLIGGIFRILKVEYHTTRDFESISPS